MSRNNQLFDVSEEETLRRVEVIKYAYHRYMENLKNYGVAPPILPEDQSGFPVQFEKQGAGRIALRSPSLTPERKIALIRDAFLDRNAKKSSD